MQSHQLEAGEGANDSGGLVIEQKKQTFKLAASEQAESGGM